MNFNGSRVIFDLTIDEGSVVFNCFLVDLEGTVK